jgi:hypothetical protein
MGGISGSLLKGALDHSTGGGVGEALWSGAKDAWSFLGAKENIRSLHPAADAAMDLDAAFIKTRNEAYQKLQAPVQKLWQGVKEDSALGSKFNYKTATMRDVHSHLTATGHPLAQHSTQIMNQNVHPKTGMQLNAGHTFEMMGVQNKLQSNRLASDSVYGPHMQNLIPYIQDLYETRDPRDKSTADLLIRVISNETHDTFNKGGAPASRTAWEIRQAFAKENKVRQKLGGSPLPLPDAKATYEQQGSKERMLHSMMVNRLAAFAALPHVPMFGNLASSPISDILKGLASMKDPHIKELSTASGILANTMHQIFYNDLMGRTGQTAKIIGQGPAAFFYKLFHMPMFNTVRMWQLSLSASVGYHSALDWAAQAAQGSRIGIERLKEFKLDPSEIMKQGGKLNDEQMKQAMFHFVNNRMFIDRPMDRSLLANANPYMRSATMFHSIVVSQARFMRRELSIMYKGGDVKGIIQFAGTLGILFPALMPWLHGLEVMTRTASPTEGLQATEKDYNSLIHPTSFGDFAGTYLDMLSHLGGFGIWHAIVQSAWNDRLSTTLLGPALGPFVVTAGDTLKAATKPDKTQTNPFRKPNPHPNQKWFAVGRDLSELAVPVVGKWVGHKLFPTLAQEREEQPKFPHHNRRRR